MVCPNKEAGLGWGRILTLPDAVKPIALAKWLTSLLSPPVEYAPRRLLIPFLGSGSEAIGALLSGGFEEIVGIEREPEYVEIARRRIAYWQDRMDRGLADVKPKIVRTPLTEQPPDPEPHGPEQGTLFD